MERRKLCAMRAGAYYHHQAWQNGRNVGRFAPRRRIAKLKNDLAGYQQHLILSRTYADEIIRRTRQTQTAKRPATKNAQKPNKSEI